MSGTHIAHGVIAYAPSTPWPMVPSLRACYAMSMLSACYAMRGTRLCRSFVPDIRHQPSAYYCPQASLRGIGTRYGTDVGGADRRVHASVGAWYWRNPPPCRRAGTRLRLPYALSGTRIGYSGGTSLRVPYGLSGTGIGYSGGTSLRPVGVEARNARTGQLTMAYALGGTQHAVLTSLVVLPFVPGHDQPQ
eukprot:645850-Rhodomonas_salina.2